MACRWMIAMSRFKRRDTSTSLRKHARDGAAPLAAIRQFLALAGAIGEGSLRLMFEM
jgi:hypothetical protein